MMKRYRSPARERRTLKRLIGRLEDGETLVMTVHGCYLLDGGDSIERHMAERLIATGLEPGGDVLFPGMSSQTYRMASNLASGAPLPAVRVQRLA
jgi:hypothetical protein